MTANACMRPESKLRGQPNQKRITKLKQDRPTATAGAGYDVRPGPCARRPTAQWLRQALMNSAKAARPCSCHACTTSIATTDLEFALLRADGDNLACLATTICLVLALLCTVQQFY